MLQLDTDYFNILPNYFCPLLIKDAALAYCEINFILLDYELGLRDGHSFNFVVQNNSVPKWCDIGSISLVKGYPLMGVDEFVRSFVCPLLLRSMSPHYSSLMRHYCTAGFSHEEAELILGKRIHVQNDDRRFVFSQLKEIISSIDFNYPKTTWSEYHDGFDFSKQQESADKTSRTMVLHRLLESIKPRRAVDFGANAGLFSLLAARAGAEVIAFEPDEAAASKCHANFRGSSSENRIKVSMSGFGAPDIPPADLVMALALTHHLYFTHHFSFEVIVALLGRGTTKHLITEYMPNGLGIGKPHVTPLPEEYAVERFLDELSRHFKKVRLIDYENYTHRKLIYATK